MARRKGVMNRKLQEKRIRSTLKSRGVSSDLIDVQALIDSRLTLEENRSSIIRYAPKMRIPDSGLRRASYYAQAVEHHEKRSQKSILMDDRKQARVEYNSETMSGRDFRRWKKNPNRYDIRGVDSKSLFNYQDDFKPIKTYGSSRGFDY